MARPCGARGLLSSRKQKVKSGWSVQRARLRIVQHKWKSGQGQGQEPVKDLSLDKSLSLELGKVTEGLTRNQT